MRQDTRTFRVDRIQGADRLQQRFIIPTDFSVRKYLARSLWLEPTYKITVHLDASVVTKVRDLHGHWMELIEQSDGTVIARFGVHNLEWVSGWVLSQGVAAEVFEPPQLIERVCQAAQGALQRYAKLEPDHTRDASD